MNNLAITLSPPSEIIDGKVTISQKARLAAIRFLDLPMQLSSAEQLARLKEIWKDYCPYFNNLKQKTIKFDITKLQEEHENYFDITRSTAAIGDLLFGNILLSYIRFIQDSQTGHNLSSIDLDHIDAALRSLTQYLLSYKGANNG